MDFAHTNGTESHPADAVNNVVLEEADIVCTICIDYATPAISFSILELSFIDSAS